MCPPYYSANLHKEKVIFHTGETIHKAFADKNKWVYQIVIPNNANIYKEDEHVYTTKFTVIKKVKLSNISNAREIYSVSTPNRLEITSFDNENICTIGRYKDDQRYGFWTYYYYDGQIYSEVMYEKGTRTYAIIYGEQST